MPIYEYKCRVCDERFDVEQSFTDETLTEIDGCSIDESGRHQVKKVFAAPAIAFKGGGFYRNDARSSSSASSTSSSTSETSSSDTSSSDTSSSDTSSSDT
ncbi:MAG: FmdB family transcriptional regulator, partial [Acidimicrobiia bacterium]|nr:FmdB family transcriptional regulator [Acidimicrobiia bacterium]